MERFRECRPTTGGNPMIFTLRNIAVRLWLSVIMGIPLSFTLYPDLMALMPLRHPSPSLFLLLIVIFIFFVTGAFMNGIGRLVIVRQIEAAGRWERAGIFTKSEACYLKAVEAFDSPLLSVFLARRMAQSVTGAIARFHLTVESHSPHMNLAVVSFLFHHPHEMELAGLWINRRFSSHPLIPPSPLEDRVITRLAEKVTAVHHPLLEGLTALFVEMKREDFAARRVFALTLADKNRCMETDDTLKKAMENLTISLNQNDLSNGMDRTDGIDRTDEIDRTGEIDQTGEIDRTGEIDHKTKLFQKEMAMDPTTSASIFSDSWPPRQRPSRRKIPSIPNPIPWLIRLAKSMGKALLGLLDKTRQWVSGSVDALLTNGVGRKILKWAVVLSMVCGLGILIANTVTHLLHPTQVVPSASEEPVEMTAPIEPSLPPPPLPEPKRFTIQVSAYLNEAHARAFLNDLSDEGIDAWVSSAEGGGKTWYLIRVGKFSTKADAAAFGDDLKGKKRISDYFVDNLKSNEK